MTVEPFHPLKIEVLLIKKKYLLKIFPFKVCFIVHCEHYKYQDRSLTKKCLTENDALKKTYIRIFI